MKVLFVNINDSSGGAARAAMRIMRGVQQNGVEAQMFVKYKYTQAIDVVSVEQFTPAHSLYKAFDWSIQKFKNQWQHYKWHPYQKTKQNEYMSDLRSTSIHGALQKLDYNILHLHWINMRFLDIRELAKIHKPIVWTLHDSWPFCGICHVPYSCTNYESHCGSCPMLGLDIKRDLAYEVFEKKQAVYKDLNLHIVTPSRWLGDCARHSALFGRFAIHVIPNCIDTDLYCPLSVSQIQDIAVRQESVTIRRVLGEAIKENRNTRPLILYGAMHATTDRVKGFGTLLSAMHFLDKQGIELQLVVFGAEKQELAIPFEHIDVTFVGYIRDSRILAALYSSADVMVVPSYSEVFCQTASEAMACGTPVVAFRCTGIQDVVADGCGYLAEPYSAEDFATGIRYCLEKNQNNTLGKNARASVKKRYAMDVVAKQYKELYDSLK